MVWQLPSILTKENTNSLLEQGFEKISQGERIFNAQLLEQFDSTALALLLAWQRKAIEQDATKITFEHLPQKLISLAKVYGITQFL